MKSNTQNAKIEAITEKTLVLGIDVGSEMHYARAFDYRGIEYSKKPFKFSNTEAGFVTFKEWILDLKERHEKDKVVPGMEPTGHYWFNLGKFLQDNEMKPVLVNPQWNLLQQQVNGSDRKELTQIKRRIDELDVLIRGLYESNVLGKLPDSTRG